MNQFQLLKGQISNSLEKIITLSIVICDVVIGAFNYELQKLKYLDILRHKQFFIRNYYEYICLYQQSGSYRLSLQYTLAV